MGQGFIGPVSKHSANAGNGDYERTPSGEIIFPVIFRPIDRHLSRYSTCSRENSRPIVLGAALPLGYRGSARNLKYLPLSD